MQTIYAMGKNATHEEIEQAAKLANCYNFIMEQPQGFHTMIGEGGSTLSGGEKHRISIGRAMLKNTAVVLLDEKLLYTIKMIVIN